MKLQVTQENLNKALSAVARIANSRQTLPILSNVIVKTIDNRLSVAATNLDIAITEYIGAKIKTPGSITLPARLMQDFIGSLPSGVIDLELTDNKLHIEAGQYHSTINGTPADEYPVMPGLSDGTVLTLPAGEFKKGVGQVLVAASSDEARPILTGVFIHNRDGFLYAAATDSYRLAEKRLGKTKEEVSLLVPATALHELLRVMPETATDLSLEYDDQQVRFTIGEVELVARLIDGQYPDYRKLIPEKFAVSAKLNRDEFIRVTKVASLFSRETAGSVTLKVAKDELSITSIASQLGENTSSATAVVLGEGEVTLNSRYILDGLGMFSGTEVTFSFNGNLEPCVIRSDDSDDYTHLIMPLRS